MASCHIKLSLTNIITGKNKETSNPRRTTETADVYSFNSLKGNTPLEKKKKRINELIKNVLHCRV